MIVRILEGTVKAGAEATFAAFARERLPAFRQVAGVRTIHLARRMTPDGTVEFAWVSVWDDPAALAAFDATSGNPPAFVRDLGDIVASWRLRHLETFDDAVAPGD
ncbi:MAG: antibiotic biosynthesis monooxygenase [Chloroflexota bacterium]